MAKTKSTDWGKNTGNVEAIGNVIGMFQIKNYKEVVGVCASVAAVGIVLAMAHLQSKDELKELVYEEYPELRNWGVKFDVRGNVFWSLADSNYTIDIVCASDDAGKIKRLFAPAFASIEPTITQKKMLALHHSTAGEQSVVAAQDGSCLIMEKLLRKDVTQLRVVIFKP